MAGEAGQRRLVQAGRPQAQPEAETWQLVVPQGLWKHPVDGLVDDSPERVARYHEHFQVGVKRQGDRPDRLPMSIDHDDSKGAGDWIADTPCSAAT